MFRKIHLELQPVEDGLLPYSDGYYVYTALLNELREVDDEASSQLHDQPNIVFNVSTVDGPTGNVGVDGYDMVFDDATYDVTIGLAGEDVPYQPLLELFLKPDATLQIEQTEFIIQSVSTKETTPAELIEDPECEAVRFQFEDPTRMCTGSVSEVLPHRAYLFDSVLAKWNYVVPESFEFDLQQSDIEKSCLLDANSMDIETRCPVVAPDETRPAFTGSVDYKPTPESDYWLELVVLARASEYLGVGADTARGLGTVSTEEIQS